MFYKTTYPSPLGEITLICDESHLLRLYLPGQRACSLDCETAQHPILTRTEAWLDAYFSGEAPSPALLPLKPEGTAFRRLIWELLLRIPYGQTVTYGTLAKKAAEILGKLAYIGGFNPTCAPKTAQELLQDFDWEKVPKEDICIPQGLF
jgi:methylated-DNA-[protein]-cysteine S-methyltransferase